MKKEEVTKESDLRCEKCNSNQTYIRRKTKEKVCKHCGHSQMLIGVEL